MKTLALHAIRLYQRQISPRKGFACAYRARTGRASCSELAHRAIRRFGLIGGLRLLDARLARCRLASETGRARGFRPRGQAGDCDCDLPCSPLDDCDCASCDWPRRERKRDKPSRPSKREAPRDHDERRRARAGAE